MFKPEKEDNQIDHARFNSESVSSRYMQLNKKKYYLASVDQNVEQLKSEQVKELTDILIQLKSQYDELIRETNRKKKETDELGKKIEMLERVEKRSKKKLEEIEEEKSNTLQIIELKKTKREEEIYTKTTLQHLIEKLKEELYMIKKNITDCEVKSKRLAKELHKEKMIEIEIKEKVNSVYSQISEQINKNLKDKSENNLVLQYYNNIISQKWSFINSADDRKEKQIKIAQEAKNDSQDKQEVEKRKVLQLCMLYNKYLRKKMEKELKDNELLEETFQKIKDITGTSNLKVMVDKIIFKDKNYNLCVAKVAERESKIEILKKDIKALEEEALKLKNNFAETDTTLNSTQETLVIEEEEKKMLKEEMELTVMLQKYQEKHKNVKLVYEKVIENIKAMTKFEKKNEKIQGDNNETINLTQTVTTSNMLDSQLIDNSNSMNFFSNQINEEELLKSYYDFLETTKKTMEMLFLCHSKKEFLNLMKEKGYEVQSQNFRANAKRESISSMKAASFTKRTVKEIQNLEPTNRTDAEYDYEDEEIRMDEEKIKKVTAEMIKSYKENERNKLNEYLKSDKDKK